MLIPKHVKIKVLEALAATINFIDIRLKLLEENYAARRVAYITAIKETFKQITTRVIKSLIPKQKVQ